MATVRTMHFKLSGKDLTRLARQRVLEDAPEHAWRIASCLNAAGSNAKAGVADAALAILDGSKKLVGDEADLRLVKESAKVRETYLDQVKWLYAGRIKVGQLWYRPVAYVTDYGPKDMSNDHGKSVDRISHVGEAIGGYSNRTWHYCGKDEIVADGISYGKIKAGGRAYHDVIFQLCGAKPHWMEVALTFEAALKEYLAADRHLDQRGHHELYGDTAEEWWSDSRKQLAMNNGPKVVSKSIAIDDSREDLLTELTIKRGPGARVFAEMVEEIEPGYLDEILSADDGKLADEVQRLKAIRESDDDKVREAEDARREELRQAKLVYLRERILKQAGDDLIKLQWTEVGGYPPTVIDVPRAPFLHWAFARLKYYDKHLPPWEVVSPIGMKMGGDDPYHTDWVIGGGLDPQDYQLLYYPGPIHDAALKLAGELQDKFEDVFEADHPVIEPGQLKVTVVVHGPMASGQIIHGKANRESPIGSIVVLPNLHPRYLKAVVHAAAVITEAGGATAHLAQIGRERSLPIVLVEDAREKYTEGMTVSVNTSSRIIIEH